MQCKKKKKNASFGVSFDEENHNYFNFQAQAGYIIIIHTKQIKMTNILCHNK